MASRASTDGPSRSRRWVDSWLQSDLVSIPLILALAALVVALVGIYLLIGGGSGIFVDKLVFPIALGALLILFLVLVAGRGRETTEGIRRPATGIHRRVLVVADRGLESEELRETVLGRGGEAAREAMIVAPVEGSSEVREWADDVDAEMTAAQERLDDVLEALRSKGVESRGHVDIGHPMNVLLDGLREFPATEVVLVRGGEPHWDETEQFADRIRGEVGIPVIEVELSR